MAAHQRATPARATPLESLGTFGIPRYAFHILEYATSILRFFYPGTSAMPYDAQKAVAFAQSRSGRYRDGECWTLVEDAVVGAGGTSSTRLTPHFSPASSFVWGTVVAPGNLQRGDVLQFCGYKWEQKVTVETTFHPKHADNPDEIAHPDGALEERGAPQHSAMVVSVVSPGVVDVVEQNIPPTTGPVKTVRLVLIAPPPKVTTETLEFETDIAGTKTRVTRTIKTTTTETVSGAPRCYRPK